MIDPIKSPTGTAYHCSAFHEHASATEAAICDLSRDEERCACGAQLPCSYRCAEITRLEHENADLVQALREAYARIRSLEESARRMLEEEK